MLRNVLLCAGLALAVALAVTGCKKESDGKDSAETKKTGPMSPEMVEGAYKGTEITTYEESWLYPGEVKTEEKTIVVEWVERGALNTTGYFRLSDWGTTARIKSSTNDSIILSIDALWQRGEGRINGSELTYSLKAKDYVRSHTIVFKGTRQ